MDGSIYEISYLVRHGEYPKTTHILASSEEDAVEKLSEKRNFSKVLEVTKVSEIHK